MPYEWNVDHDACTIRVHGHGQGATADTLALITRMSDVLAECEGYDVLYDSRELQIDSTPGDVLRIAEEIFGPGRRFRRFAIVVPPARVPLARIFAALADPHGVVANVFDDVETALEWLAARPNQRRYPRMPVRRAEDRKADEMPRVVDSTRPGQSPGDADARPSGSADQNLAEP